MSPVYTLVSSMDSITSTHLSIFTLTSQLIYHFLVENPS